jgi:hypothetical protein
VWVTHRKLKGNKTMKKLLLLAALLVSASIAQAGEIVNAPVRDVRFATTAIFKIQGWTLVTPNAEVLVFRRIIKMEGKPEPYAQVVLYVDCWFDQLGSNMTEVHVEPSFWREYANGYAEELPQPDELSIARGQAAVAALKDVFAKKGARL